MAVNLAQAADDYRWLDVKPLTGSLGAEIGGVDLSAPLGDAVRDELLRAFHEHQVIYLPDQDIGPEEHLAFARTFGPLDRIPHIFSVDGYPELQIVRRDASETDTKVTGANWHTDSTYLDRPPLAVAMRAITVPEFGGDTLFASMYRAYESLSPAMQDLLSGLKAVHSASSIFGSAAKTQQKTYRIKEMDEASGDREVVHPAAPIHPATGRRHLFVNRVYTRRFEGMTEEESGPILNFLYDHAVRPEFTCRVRWRPNQMLIWDNRCTQHRAIPDYAGKDRYLERVTIGGDRPF